MLLHTYLVLCIYRHIHIRAIWTSPFVRTTFGLSVRYAYLMQSTAHERSYESPFWPKGGKNFSTLCTESYTRLLCSLLYIVMCSFHTHTYKRWCCCATILMRVSLFSPGGGGALGGDGVPRWRGTHHYRTADKVSIKARKCRVSLGSIQLRRDGAFLRRGGALLDCWTYWSQLFSPTCNITLYLWIQL